jgi:hypothetical protein
MSRACSAKKPGAAAAQAPDADQRTRSIGSAADEVSWHRVDRNPAVLSVRRGSRGCGDIFPSQQPGEAAPTTGRRRRRRTRSTTPTKYWCGPLPSTPPRRRSMTKYASYVGVSRILRFRPRLALNRTPKQMSPINAAPATGRSRTRSPSKSNAVRKPIVEIRDRLAAERQVRYDRSTARHHQRLRPRTLQAENPGPSGVVLIHESVALQRSPPGRRPEDLKVSCG